MEQPREADPTFSLYDLRVTVERVDGRAVCGLRPGDFFDLQQSSHVVIPPGRHFCAFAMAAVLPVLIAKQRELAPADWLSHDHLFACPDPDERLLMRVTRTARRTLRRHDVT